MLRGSYDGGGVEIYIKPLLVVGERSIEATSGMGERKMCFFFCEELWIDGTLKRNEWDWTVVGGGYERVDPLNRSRFKSFMGVFCCRLMASRVYPIRYPPSHNCYTSIHITSP